MNLMDEKRTVRRRSRRTKQVDGFAVDEARLDELKSAFIENLKYIPKERPLLYLDYPVHLNIGDLLILKGAEAALTDAGYNICGRFGWMNFRQSVSDTVDRNTTIVLHGGGNFGDLYPVHQRFRERILRHFPDSRIVILPQTLHFSSQSELEASARIFRRHPDVVIMVRDKPSLKIARHYFSDQVALVPDSAHYLWRRLPTAKRTPVPGGEFRLYRKDMEADGTRLSSHLGQQAGDWMDLIPRWTQHLFGLVCRMHMAEGLLDFDLNAQPIWYRQSDFIVNHVIRALSGFGSVRSDRLHACLLGMLLGKPVALLDNSYGKLRNYFDAWFSDMPSVEYLRQPDA